MKRAIVVCQGPIFWSSDRSILDLTKPRWKRARGFANRHVGTMSFHAAALFAQWGDARAATFFGR